ncbi:CDP-diacylglycerol--serine O-phosphatidyltransferase 3 [Zea mays]|nr:CDP-diacylglycerol--serine O-phosphatidyltransferase 3 [Zea mays]|eukprot:XP_020404709.1 CDP-diacylglycerol--serine O-phosphatidyltransferase 3 [Zea mays]
MMSGVVPSSLHVLLRAERALCDRDVGEVHIPLSELLSGAPDGPVPAKFVAYQVRKISSGKPQGVLNLSYKLGEVANGYAPAPPPTKADAYPPPYGAYLPAGGKADAAYPPSSGYPPAAGKPGKGGEPVTAYPSAGPSTAAPYAARLPQYSSTGGGSDHDERRGAPADEQGTHLSEWVDRSPPPDALIVLAWRDPATAPRDWAQRWMPYQPFSWASGALDPEGAAAHSSLTSIKRGVWAMIASFLAYCTLQAPSTILIRPHPAVWRLVHGLAVVYLVALTFLLFQNRDDARQFMKLLHPDLGVELPERSYGADCRLYVPENPKNKFINIYETLFDEFVVAHILGWFGKAVMIRNQLLLWVLSIGFELMELTFRHMLPNFNECWWDSIILDILICNWFGIWAGMHTVRYFDGKTYEWVGLSRQRSIMGKVGRGKWRRLNLISRCFAQRNDSFAESNTKQKEKTTVCFLTKTLKGSSTRGRLQHQAPTFFPLKDLSVLAESYSILLASFVSMDSTTTCLLFTHSDEDDNGVLIWRSATYY